ncbi:MAG: hypothetical protein KKG33_11875 [candidate division Zixibacteria bacterium]|nr:hypothetical protein [candidate division Zixibacteria bacterium]MBU1471522.1 hypothetical protein [candidate division Zixibacteria bacterium]MBU2626247.1 hypothetical protein [candidate division Zixibacteria bacterium]
MDHFIRMTNIFRLLSLIFVLAILTLAGCGQSVEKGGVINMQNLMPTEIAGWKADAATELYDRETIFDYMDGAGEVYRMYDYREMAVRRFVNPTQPGIVVEIFDMGSSKDAFGIFSHSRDEEVRVPGQGAEYRTGMFYFWKDKYFVSIVTEKETPETKEALCEMAAAIDLKIKSKGAKPDILECLPDQNLSASSVRYFHLYTSLNYHYYLSDQNILMLSDKTDAVLGIYQPDAAYLTCIRYPDNDLAAKAFTSFSDAYIPEAGGSGIAQTENGKWVVSEPYERYILLVFDATSESYGRELIAETKKRLSEI